MKTFSKILKIILVLFLAVVLIFSVGTFCKSCADNTGITLPSWFPSWGLFNWFNKAGGTQDVLDPDKNDPNGVEDPDKPGVHSYKVTFRLLNGESTSIDILENEIIGENFPEDPQNASAINSSGCPVDFLGWFDDDVQITRETIVTKDIMAKETWRTTPHNYVLTADNRTDEHGHTVYEYSCATCHFECSSALHILTLDSEDTDDYGHVCKNYSCEFCDHTAFTVTHIYGSDNKCILCNAVKKEDCDHDLRGNYCIKCGEFISVIKNGSQGNDNDSDDDGNNGGSSGGDGKEDNENGENKDPGDSGTIDDNGNNGNSGDNGNDGGGDGGFNGDWGMGLPFGDNSRCPFDCDEDCMYNIDCCDCPECREHMCCGQLPSARDDTVSGDLGLDSGQKGFRISVNFESAELLSYFDVEFGIESYSSGLPVVRLYVKENSPELHISRTTCYVDGGSILDLSATVINPSTLCFSCNGGAHEFTVMFMLDEDFVDNPAAYIAFNIFVDVPEDFVFD